MGSTHSGIDSNQSYSVIWKWEHRQDDYYPYSKEISEIIERHFLMSDQEIFQIRSSNGLVYKIDLREKIQINPLTNNRRKIIREVISDIPLSVKWSWVNNKHEMEPYANEISNKIEEHYTKGSDCPLIIYLFGRKYAIDTKKMTQTNLVTGRVRKIERNKIPSKKFLWQWQKDNGTFVKFQEKESSYIENHFKSKRKEILSIKMNSTNYIIDTENMFIKDSEGKVKQIRRIKENYIKYAWWWQDREKKWNPFSPYHNEKLEQNYLSINQSPILIAINGKQFEVNTKEMKERSVQSGKVYNIKREPISNDRAVWIWVIKSGKKVPFPVAISNIIESQYFLEDYKPLEVEIRDKKATVDIQNMSVVFSDKKERQIGRLVIENYYPSRLELLSRDECKKVFKHLVLLGYLPPDWDCSQVEETKLFEASDTELCLIADLFYQNSKNKLSLREIKRIQNATLVNNFVLERINIERFQCSNEEPLLLFYVSAEDSFDKLLKRNEIALCEESKLSFICGKQYYFFNNAELCNKLSPQQGNNRFMLIFWVLLGKTAVISSQDDIQHYYGNSIQQLNEIRFPPKGYDSLQINNENETYFLLFNPERCYPLYLLNYELVLQ